MDKYPNINKVGVELEGGWNRDSEYRDDIKGDCSVQVNDNGDDYDPDEEDDDYHSDSYINGEIVSSPISRWDDLSYFTLNKYPDKVNETCGLHVHVSTNTVAHYQALVNERFYNFMKYSLHNWGKKANVRPQHRFWNRLKGHNDFCNDFFDPDGQMFETSKSGRRYCIVNYCFSLHGTMEVRVLPMFEKPKVSLAAINHVLWTVNKYLSLPSMLKIDPFHYEEAFEMDVDPVAFSSLVNVA